MSAAIPTAEKLERHSIPEPNTGCIIWLGAGLRGYGHVRVDGKTQLAHRVAYELKHGPLPADVTLDHRCRLKPCINDVHLEPVSRTVNILRSDGAGALAARREHCPKGHPYTILAKKQGRAKRRCYTCDRENWRRRRLNWGRRTSRGH